MEMALNAKNKLGFVDGSIPPPSSDLQPQEFAVWKRNNDIVSSWILNLVSNEIVASIILWNMLLQSSQMYVIDFSKLILQ